MAKFLYRLGSSAYRHKWRFISVWLVIVVGMGIAAATLAQSTSSSFSIPGIPSEKAQNLMNERFDSSENQSTVPTGTLVFQAQNGKTLEDPAEQQQVNETLTKLKDSGVLKNTDSLVDPTMAAAGVAQKITAAGQQQHLTEQQIQGDIAAVSPLSPDKKTGTAQFTFNADTNSDITSDQKDKFKQIVDDSRTSDLKIEYEGNAFSMTGGESGASELIGIAVALVVLMVTFGSLIAAGLPILTAIVGVSIGVLGVSALTGLTDTVNESTPMLASMIGLAVGIDYALFITSRYKNELSKTDDRAHAAGRAVGTAGSAVVFAGLTVLIALCALSVVNIPFLTTMALAAAATVAIAVLVALSLVPAMFGLFGKHIFKVKIPFVEAPDPEREKPTMGLKWVRMIRKHPWLFLGAGVIVLALLAIPMGQLKLAMPTDATSNPNESPRKAYDMVDDAFGPGRNAPLLVVVDAKDVAQAQRQASFATAVKDISQIDGVKNAMISEVNKAGDAAMILVTPTTGSIDSKTADTMRAIRDEESNFNKDTGANYGVTGITAIQTDISDRLDSVLIPYIAIVLVLAFLILMLVFRSILVPFIAAPGFALTVSATFGITVGVFQNGWLGIIPDPQPIVSFLPIMLIGIVFGLAMDYEVFLVSRMREGWHHGKTAGNATANGFKHGARVVTAAALIMISVFAAFMLQDMQVIKTMGFALAIAVLFDAFIVRMTIIPATMFILGDKAWWLPKWMDKILPHVDIEGEGLTEEATGTHAADSNHGAESTIVATPVSAAEGEPRHGRHEAKE